MPQWWPPLSWHLSLQHDAVIANPLHFKFENLKHLAFNGQIWPRVSPVTAAERELEMCWDGAASASEVRWYFPPPPLLLLVLELISNAAIVGVNVPEVELQPGQDQRPTPDTAPIMEMWRREGRRLWRWGHAAQILINLNPPYLGPVLSTSYVVCWISNY